MLTDDSGTMLLVVVIAVAAVLLIIPNAYVYAKDVNEVASQVTNCSGSNENCINHNPQAQGTGNELNSLITSPLVAAGTGASTGTGAGAGAGGGATTEDSSSQQTVVTLHDDEDGNAAGWNPGRGRENFRIITPFTITQEMSFEFTFINPPGDSISNDDENNQFAGNCDLFAVDNTTMTADTLVITCFNDFLPTTPTPTPTPIDDESGIHIVPSGGATLTYVMTQEQEQGQQQQQNRLMQQQTQQTQQSQQSQQTQEQQQQDDVKSLN